MPADSHSAPAHAGRASGSSKRLTVGYVVGTSYCGSTLLSLLAAAHPKVASVGEVAPNVRRRQRDPSADFYCSCLKLVSECPFWTAVFDRMAAGGFPMSASRWSNDYRYVNPLMHRLFDVRSRHWLRRPVQGFLETAAVLPKVRARRIDRTNVAFVKASLDVRGADVFLDATKDIGRLSRLLRIPEMDVRVVRLLRDVRADVESRKRRGQGAADAARSWLAFQQSADELLAGVPGDRVMVLPYEELSADHQPVMDRIFAHLGLEPVPMPPVVDPSAYHVLGNQMRLGGPFSVKLNERWRESITPGEIETAVRIAGDYQRQFGYAP